ncbi:MAG: response regulator [Verrucomicrobiia bacterium]|jgi:CheY-like chemotaxis protein
MSTKKILLVDDDSDVRMAVRSALEESGYQIWEASDGSQAVNIWKTKASQIDLLLADLAMPGSLNGRQLADKFRRERPSLKVIFTSGHFLNIPDMAGIIQSHGCFLQKPFSPETLAEIVRSHLNRTRLAN